jgi:hypothetical protein
MTSKVPDVVKIKKPYESPRLVEYGTVAKLTQGASGAGADAINMKTFSPCL